MTLLVRLFTCFRIKKKGREEGSIGLGNEIWRVCEVKRTSRQE